MSAAIIHEMNAQQQQRAANLLLCNNKYSFTKAERR